MRFSGVLWSVLGTCLLAANLQANSITSILVGSTSGGPVQEFSTSGSSTGTSFGDANATAAAFDGMGDVFAIQPGDNSSTISEYDSTNQLVTSFLFNSGISNGFGFPGFLDSIVYGGNSTFWVAGYNGFVYHINSSGGLLSSFDSGNANTAVTTDGTSLYTTSGYGNGLINIWTPSGSQTGMILTPFQDTLGIGYDATTQSLYIGGSDVVSQLDLNGNLLNTLSISGANTAIDVGTLGNTPPPPPTVPEPGTWALCFGGLGLLGVWRVRRAARIAGN